MSSTLMLVHPATRVRVGDVALLPSASCAGATRVPASVRNGVATTPAHHSWATHKAVRELAPAYGTRFAVQGPPPRGPLV